MAYGTPADPVGGTIITVAYAVSNILNPLRWLRLMTGNADPPGSSYVVVSDSTTGTSWRKVPGDALAAGAVVSHLGYTPVNRGGDTITGSLTVAGGIGTTTGTFSSNVGISGTLGVSGPVTLSSALGVGGNVGISGTLGVSGAGTFSSDLGVGASLQVGTTGTFGLAVQGQRVLTTVSDALTPPYTAHANQASVTCTNVRAASSAVADAATTATTAANLGGVTATATPTASKIPISNASGNLDPWVTASGSIPTGLGGWVRQASEIPTGFSRESNLDGRIPVGAGTTFTVTFTENTNYGSAWSFTPTDSGHSHSGASLGVGGRSGASSGSNTAIKGITPGETSAASTTHDHDNGTYDVTGNTDAASAVMTATTWTIPSRGVVWVRKN